MTGKPEVIGSSVGLVPRNALVMTEPTSSDCSLESSRRRWLSHQRSMRHTARDRAFASGLPFFTLFNLDDQVLSFNLENRSMPQESIAAPHLNHFATSNAMDVAPHVLDRHSAR
jgi:hypothetical protein